MDLFELTKKLIDIPSLSSDEEAVGEFLAAHLESLGYKVERQEVQEGRFNVLATTGAPPRVVLSTHMDTVPPHLASSENDEWILGRGACDAKGIIATQIIAAERLRAEGMNEIALLFTVDEEQGSEGARIANTISLASECEYLINGEPTDNKLASATKGSLRLTLTARGQSAHSAYPEQGESAIEKLLDVLQDIRQCQWPSDALLGETTCNIGVISGGTRANVIPAAASAVLQLRLVSDPAAVKSILAKAIAGRAEVEYLSVHEPVHLFTVTGFEQCVVRFTTDIPYLSCWGKPLLLGPGSILKAHTDGEGVRKKELLEAVDLYTGLARNLLLTQSIEPTEQIAEGVPR
ncbi:MAG TPA: M20/M25/M40 family metallo-hydrolase [Pyrinomonadaceae bacterium]|nr:M20/M25/M40 family metallo-hydrolase [Pyrinomonadaceae bacterium]